ncbi:hypothetical protein IVB38_15500 [Bradyrhizobium sp. 38]|jgi:hypothetical protein|uniref:hypothetical protein n=1 Tax=unclassified Bradyrhizobium TaxID=2631580 RepID=UPI001FF8582F|nr:MULTISPECIES: hypothetical protein [unclassified Bradyrhizobium]MCK1337398.1 hypothetical protein [Bradyrhizobium sp. 38]MCK1778592.1 hypothetical protein [Bradyrhizobium sp. 132]
MAKAKKESTGRTVTRRRNTARRLSKRRESPIGRLSTDGASSPRNINRRLQWLAVEWRLDAPPRVGRTLSEAVADYCQRHRISFDWMLGGCLIGLKKMVDERRGRETQMPTAEQIGARYAQLSPEDQAIVTAKIKRILAARDQ